MVHFARDRAIDAPTADDELRKKNSLGSSTKSLPIAIATAFTFSGSKSERPEFRTIVRESIGVDGLAGRKIIHRGSILYRPAPSDHKRGGAGSVRFGHPYVGDREGRRRKQR